MTVFIAITADEFELPMLVTPDMKEIMRFLDRPANGISQMILTGRVHRRMNCKVIKIKMEADDELN